MISFKMHKGQYFNGRFKKFKYKYTSSNINFGLVTCTKNLVTYPKVCWWKREQRIQKILASKKKSILKVSHYTQSSLSEGTLIEKVRSVHEFFTDAKFSHYIQLQLAEHVCATGGSWPGVIYSLNTPVPCFQNTPWHEIWEIQEKLKLWDGKHGQRLCSSTYPAKPISPTALRRN